jgi:hypothetical protein
MLLELAQELRENIVDYFPLKSAKYVSRLFRINLSEKKRVQQIWDEIFKDRGWINSAREMGLTPILVGHDLYDLCYRYKGPYYLVLVDGDWSGDLRYKKPNILDCLNPHSFDKKTNEVTFKNSNIILNIDGQIRASEEIAVAPTKIFSRRSVSSATLVWGETALRKISRKDVTGTRNKASLDTISIGCYFDLSDKKWRWDQCFLVRDYPRDFRFARFPRLGKYPVN